MCSGKVIGYQYHTTDGAAAWQTSKEINLPYIDGISLTHGSPKKHIWSFLSGRFHDAHRKVTVLVVVILLKLFHHLSVQTITVRLTIKLHVHTLECSTLMIHYGMVKIVVIVKSIVATVLLFLGL